jgi:hypothetical protein
MEHAFKPEELITKNGKSYPVVGARLRVAHEENEHLEIITDVISFEVMDQAVVKAMVKSDKGTFSAYGVASASKDSRLIDSLLELAETRSIARALRFAGYGVEYTGIEEIGDAPAHSINKPSVEFREVGQGGNSQGTIEPLSMPQHRAIEAIAKSHHWNVLEAVRRITHRNEIKSVDELSKQEAIQVIRRFKEQVTVA